MLPSNLLDIFRTCTYFLYCLKCPVRVRVCSCVVSLFLWKKSHHFCFLLTEITWTSFYRCDLFLVNLLTQQYSHKLMWQFTFWPSVKISSSFFVWLLHFSVRQSLLCRHHLPVNERDARSHVCSLDHWCKKHFNPKTLCGMFSLCLKYVCMYAVYLFFF